MLTSKSKKSLYAVLIVLALATVFALVNKSSFQKKAIASKELRSAAVELANKAAFYNSSAKQDQNPMVALIDSNYGLAYLATAQSLVPQELLQNQSRLDINDLNRQLTEQQQKALTQLTKV